MCYQAPLLILENDELKEVPLIEIYRTSKGLDHIVSADTFENYWPKGVTKYDLLSLGLSLTDKIKRINEKFVPVVEDRKDYDLLEKLLETKVRFATKEAYIREHKEEGKEEKDCSVGTFLEEEGILISLQEASFEVDTAIVHEYGHALHYKLTPELYKKSTPTMKEIMAIFLQRSFGLQWKFRENSPHYEALRILLNLEDQPYFSKLSFEKQWTTLISIVDQEHPDLQRLKL